MKRPTYKSIQEAAKKSKRAAIKNSIQKYLYLMGLSPKQVRTLPKSSLHNCALCLRYNGDSNNCCPLQLNCDGCIPEYQSMCAAWRHYRKPEIFHNSEQYYYKFITYATKIYLKLLEL